MDQSFSIDRGDIGETGPRGEITGMVSGRNNNLGPGGENRFGADGGRQQLHVGEHVMCITHSQCLTDEVLAIHGHQGLRPDLYERFSCWQRSVLLA